jgi:hypothetical protein
MPARGVIAAVCGGSRAVLSVGRTAGSRRGQRSWLSAGSSAESGGRRAVRARGRGRCRRQGDNEVAGGGLNYGDGPVSLVLAILIVALVAYLSITAADREPDANTDWHGLGRGRHLGSLTTSPRVGLAA